MKTWKFRSSSHASARSLADAMNLPLPLARILVSRGFGNEEAASAFLYASLDELSGPYRLLNMGVAVEGIEEALKQKKKIVVYGDYDVDGICAVTLLHEVFAWFGVDVATYIPSRFKEGYGLNGIALEKLHSEGYELVITVDNGIAAKDLVEAYQKKGMDFIVTDHHSLPEALPTCTIVNPLLCEMPEEPFYRLCGTGVAYMLAMAMLIRLKPEAYDEWHRRKLLDLVALATVADMVPLLNDNRILVREGLRVINASPRAGLRALIELTCGDKDIFASDIAYRLAPCVNACGRLDRTDLAVALFRYDQEDEDTLTLLATEVRDTNSERKDIEREMTKEAIARFEDYTGKMMSAVAFGEDWHPGVIGVTAARLVEHFHVPSIVFTAAGSGDEALLSGSARSVKGFDLFENLSLLKDHLVRFGGHKMAAGLTIKRENLAAFTEAFNEACSHFEEAIDQDELWIDDVLRLDEATEELEKAMRLMEPCGFDNTEPLFALEHQGRFEHHAIGHDGDHLRLSFPTKDGGALQAIAFRKGDYEFLDRRRYDFAFHLGENCFRGLCRLQLNVTDIAPSWQAEERAELASVMRHGETYAESELGGLCDKPSFYTKIRGVSYANRQDLITSLKVGNAITLLREANNPADKNAVACLTKDGGTVGYLSRAIAAQLAPMMDLGAHYAAEVCGLTGGEAQNHGVNLLVRNLSHRESNQSQMASKETLASLDTDALLAILTDAIIGDEEPNEIQIQAVRDLLDHKDTAVVMPTGRGKSLIYQLAAGVFAMRDKKLTVVISPLKALINDQYLSLTDHLAPLGLRIYKGNGDLSQKEREALLAKLEAGEVDLLLATPEFFVRHRALFLAQKERLGMIVLDEAHHALDKRVAYRALRQLKSSFEESVWLYLTATVPQAQSDAFAQLISGAALYIDEHIRYNLHITDGRHSDQKLVYLYRLFMHPEKTICYVNSRKQAFALARRLREILPYELRALVGYYHGGLPQASRRAIEEAFKEGELRLLFATTAFGEGINISDIRHVVLYHPCFSLEAFNQLAGRGGRDGEDAQVHLLYAERDFALNEMIVSGRGPSRERLGMMYQLIMRYAKTEGYDLSMNEEAFYETLQGLKEGTTKNQWRLALTIFEELDFLKTKKVDEDLEVHIEQNPAKRDLGESPSYLEGTSEQTALEQFKQVAFSKDLAALENIIRKALVPAHWQNGR